jgi:methanogenic corrinoid protein MtbC1
MTPERAGCRLVARVRPRSVFGQRRRLEWVGWRSDVPSRRRRRRQGQHREPGATARPGGALKPCSNGVQNVDVLWAPAYSAGNGGLLAVRLFDRFRSEPVYNTRAVVQRTGVPADTFRAWERRYGLPQPSRTGGNQRLYSERDIALIGWLRDQTQAGLTISQAVALFRVDDGDEAVIGGGGPGPVLARSDGRRASGGGATRLSAFRERVVEALIAFNGGAAEQAVEEAAALVAVDDVCRHVLEAGLVEIGERWQREEIGVGAEHFASCFVMRKLSALFNLSLPQHGRGPVVAACVEGELHEIGLLLRSLLLSRHGFRIVYLGANLPCADLLSVVEELGAPVVLLSATTQAAIARLTETIAALRAANVGTSGPTVGYGGRIFLDRPELRDRVDGVFLGDDDRGAVESVQRMMSGIDAGSRG